MKKTRWIDGHFHLSLTKTMSRLDNVADTLHVLADCGLEAICIQNIVLWFPEHLLRNPLSLLAKLQNPQSIYSFGGIRFPEPEKEDKHFDYLQQAQELIALGFDGIKLFGKPNMRQAFGEPFDSPVFSQMFDWLAEQRIPVLFHVGDPREFWSRETAPAFAVENGWLYETPPFDAYYEEVERLMRRHPNLNILFPHFFFLSDDLEKLRGFLNRWKTVWIDITPGSEMYHNFTQTPAAARAFFLEFQDRILLGTDNTGDAEGEAHSCVSRARDRLNMMAEFLSGDRAEGWGETFCGLRLPEDVLEKIFYQNFYRFIGRTFPRTVEAEAAFHFAKDMQRLAAKAEDPGLDREFGRVLLAYEKIMSV